MGRPPAVCPHGTTAGYQCHLRRAETACSACRTAWRIYYQKRNGSLPALVRRDRSEAAKANRRKRSRNKVDARRSGRFLVPKVEETDTDA